MCGIAYRPRPANGSGDSPRPPFLSEFVNHVGKLSLVEVVYHLFGGTLRVRIHPHIERSFRLKTESACGVVKLQAADPNVSQDAVNRSRLDAFRNLRERSMQQSDRRPVRSTSLVVGRWPFTSLANDKRRTTKDEPFCSNLERCWILIEPNQMSR